MIDLHLLTVLVGDRATCAILSTIIILDILYNDPLDVMCRRGYVYIYVDALCFTVYESIAFQSRATSAWHGPLG